MTKLPKISLYIIIISLSLGLGASCVSVKSYERGALSDPIMTYDTNYNSALTLEASVFYVDFNEHSLIYVGGVSAGGGCPFCK